MRSDLYNIMLVIMNDKHDIIEELIVIPHTLLIFCFPVGNKPTMDQLCVLTARDESEIRIIETVADEDWGRMAVALGFDHPTRVNIALQASLEAVTACRDMFDRWLEGGENLKPATWSILMKCLEESGFTDMARKVNEFMLYIRQH